MTRENPERPEPWAGLAQIAWTRGDMDSTGQNFAKAYSLGARSERLLWDYGRLAEHNHSQEAIQVFRELLKPERTDVRMELAGAQLSSNHPVDTVVTIAALKNISSKDAPRIFTLLAYAYLRVGDRDEAARIVTRLAQYAVTPEDRDRAEQLKRYLDQPKAPALIPSAITEGDRPRLVRRTAAGVDEEEIATPSLSAAGSFVELVYNGKAATIVLETDQGRKRFLIEEPSKVNLVAAAGGGVQDFQCGPQKPAKVKVEYRLAEAGQNVNGLVTGIYFLP